MIPSQKVRFVWTREFWPCRMTGGTVIAFEDFSAAVRATPVVERMLIATMVEAAQALRDICREFERTGLALGDHHLPAGGYMGEMVVRALLEAGLIAEGASERGSLHQYLPTDRGREVYAGLKDTNAFSIKAGQVPA